MSESESRLRIDLRDFCSRRRSHAGVARAAGPATPRRTRSLSSLPF